MADTEPLDGYGDVPKEKTPAEKAAGAASFILFAGLTAGCMALEPAPGTADIGSESMWARARCWACRSSSPPFCS
eukprot:COSAG06_NODE_12299_length_1398_cov_0.973056_2_plen_75_part_00